MLLVADRRREVLHNLLVRDVAPEGGLRELEVVADQPGDKPAVILVKPVHAAEAQRLSLAEHGVMAAAPLRDVMEERSDGEEHGLLQAVVDVVEEDELLLFPVIMGEVPDVLQCHDGVLVDSVEVEHVELHLSHNLLPLLQVFGEHSVDVHLRQGKAERVRVREYFEEYPPAVLVLAEVAVDLPPRAVYRPDAAVVYPVNLRPLRDVEEHLEHPHGPFGEDARPQDIDLASSEDEVIVYLGNLPVGARALDPLLEDFHDYAGDLVDAAHDLEEPVHELLDGPVPLADVAQDFRNLLLPVKKETVVVFRNGELQREPGSEEKILAGGELAVLGRGKVALGRKIAEVRGAVKLLRDPDDGLYVAEPALVVLEIRLEEVDSVIVMAVPLLLLLLFGPVKFLHGPEVRRAGLLRQGEEGLLRAVDEPCLEKVRGDGYVAETLADALVDRPYRVPDVNRGVPEHCDIGAHELSHVIAERRAGHDEDVDVCIGMQLHPAVAADRDERQIRDFLPEIELIRAFPEEVVNEAAAELGELADACSGEELLLQVLGELPDALLAALQGDRLFAQDLAYDQLTCHGGSPDKIGRAVRWRARMARRPSAILHYGRSGMMDNAIYVAFFLRAVGQDLDAVLGYEERVLVLSGGLTVLSGYCPAVVLVDAALPGSGVDHGLDGEGHAGLEDEVVAVPEMQDLRLLVELTADAVPAVVADN